MELNQFARIGKGVLSKSIGLQKNYVEEYVKSQDKLNENKSGCHECPIYKAKQQFIALDMAEAAEQLENQCKNCSTSVWEASYTQCIRYINEKNKYGYQPTLKCNAIKLLLLYHFLQPDERGFLKNISIKSLASTIGCTVATIHACNSVLSKYNYCYICESGLYDNHINVYLTEYKNYHKTAAEGGRGYITMSSDMLMDLIGISSLNTLRLNIKGILEVDNVSYSQTQNKNYSTVDTTYKKLRGFLPAYCKNNIIRKALEKDTSIFDLTFYDKGVSFSIHPKYAQKQLRNSMLENTKDNLIDFVDSINNAIDILETAKHPDEQAKIKESLSSMHISNMEKYPPLTLQTTDYMDLASLSLQYNPQIVRSAIIHIYNTYIASNHPIEKFGALTRTVIRNMSFSKIAA